MLLTTLLPGHDTPPAAISTRRLARGLTLALVAAFLVGCAANPGQGLPPYGDSVRHMKEAQTYQPGDKVPTLSGDKAARALETYRRPADGTGQQSPSMDMSMP